ncbi:MAG: VanZ family protein [Gemmatimonadota bacterium]|nr:VanZ family protein [Gemmatimonadota bacterium]
MSLKTIFWLPALLWMALIFLASSFVFPIKTGRLFSSFDKVVHMIEFGILGILLAKAVYGQKKGDRHLYWLCILAAALYGGLDELHQYFVPGRSNEWSDFAADALGAFFLTWGWLAWKGESLFRKAENPGLLEECDEV